MEPVKGGALAKVPATVKEIFAASAHPERTPAEWALRFCAGLEGVIMVLSGMSDMDQLNENTAFMDKTEPLTEEELHTIEQSGLDYSDYVVAMCYLGHRPTEFWAFKKEDYHKDGDTKQGEDHAHRRGIIVDIAPHLVKQPEA